MTGQIRSKILFMGVGNELFSDEGIGVHVYKELVKLNLPDNIELLEAGTAGLEILHLIEEVDALVVVDAVNAGAEPGAIFKFKPDDISVLPAEFQVSAHQLGLFEVITMATVMGKLPPTTVFGIQPGSMAVGMELTAEVKAKLPVIVDFVLKEFEQIVETERN